MFDDHSDVIRDIALEAGLVTPAQAEEIWESHATTGKSFSQSLMDAGLADRAEQIPSTAVNALVSTTNSDGSETPLIDAHGTRIKIGSEHGAGQG